MTTIVANLPDIMDFPHTIIKTEVQYLLRYLRRWLKYDGWGSYYIDVWLSWEIIINL